MAGMDYGVIVFKNKQLLEDIDTDSWYVNNGMAGEFVHPTGLTFYRMSIKDHQDIEEAKTVIRLEEELTYENKKALTVNVNGIRIKVKEIADSVFESKFKDSNGDWFTVIHGYDVAFDGFWSQSIGKVIKKHIKKAQQ